MAGQASTEFHLEIAHILFIDTVGYSKLLTKEQRELQNTLNEVVHAAERFRSAEAAGKLIRLPTGDGMALVFGDSLESPIICALEICRAIRDHPGFKLRMGIHSGPVTRLVDVNGQSNVAGGGMNMAERVMSCADANHILLSKRAADDLAEYERWRPYLHDLGDCEGKHGAKLSVVNFYTEECGNPELPTRFKEKQISEASPANDLSPPWRKIMVGAGLLLFVGILALYFFAHNSGHRATTATLANQQAPAVMPAAEKSIAVLPFENLSEKKSDANFANGVHDEILTDLAKVADLKVISRTSTMQYRTGMERNLREIGKALGTAHVVEGSVQRDGHRVRVSVQLIDARSDIHLWAESYDRDVADTFALESELAETIVAQLKAKLSPEEKAAIEEESTADPLAHDLYLEANGLITTALYNVQGTQNLFEAADLLEKAVARDPNYFRAYCKLASVHDQIYLNGPDHTPARLALAGAAVKAAQRLRPDAGETHLALAEHLYCGFLDYDRARQELELARRSLPNEPLVFELAGFIDRRQGRWDASTRNLLRALELDPRNTYTLQQIAVSYQLLRRFDDAAAMIDRALAIVPNDPGLRVARAALDLHARADSRAMHTVIDKIVNEDPGAATGLADEWFYLALCEHDPAAAEKAVAAITAEGFSNEGVLFPRAWCEGLVARLRDDFASERGAFAGARTRVEENLRDEPDHAQALCVLGMIDAALGHKDDAIREGRRAVALLPLDKDSINGALAIEYLAVTYAWTGETDQAIEQLTRAAAIPGDVSYGQLRLHPFWDSLRGDPRFEKIAASLAPAAGSR
jgi:TolB-like protein/Tfp pilus assembly protein PilF